MWSLDVRKINLNVGLRASLKKALAIASKGGTSDTGASIWSAQKFAHLVGTLFQHFIKIEGEILSFTIHNVVATCINYIV